MSSRWWKWMKYVGNLVTSMNFQPLEGHCDHIGPLMTTKFGQNVAHTRANNLLSWLFGPWAHFEGNNELVRAKSAKKRLCRTSFRCSCGLIYQPNFLKLVSNDDWLQEEQVLFSALLSETTSWCQKTVFCPKMENRRSLFTKITT